MKPFITQPSVGFSSAPDTSQMLQAILSAMTVSRHRAAKRGRPIGSVARL
jgi:hypothetical protein